MCNSEEVSMSEGSCTNTTFVSEDMSHSKVNTFLNILSRRQDIKSHKKEEVESDKVIAVEQDHSLTLYLSLGVGLPSVVIVVAVAIIIRRKRRRRNGGYL